MPSTTTPAGRPDYLWQLSVVREDPEVKRLALRRAGSPDVAEDALQETYCIMAQVKDPDRIENLRAYFCRVLIRTIYSLLGQLGSVLVDDFPGLADACTGKADGPPLDETVSMRLLVRTWVARLTARRQDLADQVPGRSMDPGRYRTVIVSAAGRVLLSLVSGSVRDADINTDLRAAYPEWFAQADSGAGNAHQRYSRARGDIDAVLRNVISRDDLYP